MSADAPVRVKICGVRSYADAYAAAKAGADLLGFNFYARSKRVIEPDAAADICDRLRAELSESCPVLVGVFVNDSVGRISALMEQAGLDFAQLSGDESDEMLAELRGLAFKGIRPMNRTQALDDAAYYAEHLPDNPRAPSLLLDAYKAGEYGGTGLLAADEIALAVKDKVPRLMLAGGLTPENIAARAQAVLPWGVDVASGVEGDTPGRKDHGKMRAFVQALRAL